MRNKLLTLAVAGMLSVSASEARGGGSTYDFGLFCGGNDLQTCAAVQISTSGGWLQIDVLNLSGWLGTPENTVFTAIGLNGLNIVGATNLEVSFAGGAWENAAGYGWSLDSGNFDAGFTAEIIAEGLTPNNAIASDCATSPPGLLADKWFTPGCLDGSVDYSQAVSFRFQFTSIGTLSDGSVLLRGQNVGTGDDVEGSLVCDTATNCTPTTTPEPGTLVLLGTGLAGILGIARRRQAGIDMEDAEV